VCVCLCVCVCVCMCMRATYLFSSGMCTQICRIAIALAPYHLQEDLQEEEIPSIYSQLIRRSSISGRWREPQVEKLVKSNKGLRELLIFLPLVNVLQ